MLTEKYFNLKRKQDLYYIWILGKNKQILKERYSNKSINNAKDKISFVGAIQISPNATPTPKSS